MSIKRMELAIKFSGLSLPSGDTVSVSIELHALHELQERTRFGETGLLRHTKFVALKGGPRPDGRQHSIEGPRSALEKLADQLETDYRLRNREGLIGVLPEQLKKIMLGLVTDIRQALR